LQRNKAEGMSIMAYLLVFRRYAPFKSFGGGFEGDDRPSPSLGLDATARTIGVVVFSVGCVGSATGLSSGTAFVGLGSSVQRFSAAIARSLGRSHSKISASVTVATANLERVSFVAQTAGANPMVPLVAPDIDTFVDFQAVFRSSTVEFFGKVRGDSFPNAEIIVYDQCLTPALIFYFRTTGGRNTGPITRLMGSGKNNTIGSFRTLVDVDDHGQFRRAIDYCESVSG
jgi:hypothetical protein